MKQYTVHTLVDITETHQYRKLPDQKKEREQQQNFQMLLQAIGMRSNVEYIESPTVITTDCASLFGEAYTGMHRVWSFTFATDNDDVFNDGTNEIGHLLEALHYVPITTGLDETAKLAPATFNTAAGKYCNTFVTK